jgi:plasmid stabilization system protein ParE
LTSSTDWLIINQLIDDAMAAKPAHLHLVGDAVSAARDGEDALDQVFAALADPVRRGSFRASNGSRRARRFSPRRRSSRGRVTG